MEPHAAPDRPWPRWTARALAAILDPTVFFSFDSTGYRVHSALFQEPDIEGSLRGRTCLVTGANSGIGLAAARAFAQREAEVWLLCRNEERGQQAREAILREFPQARVQCALLDVASLASIRAFEGRFAPPQIDVLVHNAGAMPKTRTETAEGLEVTWATNVVGPFRLTRLLLTRLRAAKTARVITVSSGGMYLQRLSLADVDFRRTPFSGVRAYAQTKRAQVVLNEMWSEREAGPGVSFSAMHPGWVDTPALAASLPGFYRLMRNRLRTAEQGADTIVWLACCPPSAVGCGRFWFDRQPRRTHVFPWTRETQAERRELWELCCRQAAGGNEAT